MKIKRGGATANHGLSTIEPKAETLFWGSANNVMVIKSSSCRDFTTSANHRYTLELTLDELGQCLKELSRAAINSPHPLELLLEPYLKNLAQLLAVASGTKS